MGIAREHPGHRAAAAERIAQAREHYDKRSERRLTQTWNKVTRAWEKVVAK